MSRYEPKALAPPLVSVLDVVRIFIIHEGGIQSPELFRHIVHAGHGLGTQDMRQAMLFFYRDVYSRNIVKYDRKKRDVVSEPHSRTLAARSGYSFAYAAIHRFIQHLVLNI